MQGPQAAATLGDWGADVVKIELPGIGDQSRWLPPSPTALRGAVLHRLQPREAEPHPRPARPEGRETFLRLAEEADVFISNFKSGTLDDWGLSYEEVVGAQPAHRLRRRHELRHRGHRRRPGGRRSQRAGVRRVDQHDRRRRRSAQPDRRHDLRSHRLPQPGRRDQRGPVRAGADRTGAADRRVAARRADLGAGVRDHRDAAHRARRRADRIMDTR